MKIAIIGYGKVGKAIERKARENNIVISRIIKSISELEHSTFNNEEIAIEFTRPSSCIANLYILAKKNVTTVCGTTGWYDDIKKVQAMYKKKTFLYGPNFSLGINIFLHTITKVGSLINKFHEYDISIHESHHKAKQDYPSGTALKTANTLLKKINRKNKIVTNIQNNKQKELLITHQRCDNVIGKHQITFNCAMDYMKILHSNKDRMAYAIGAIHCAQWLKNKKGFYTFNDYFEEIIQ